MQVKIDNLDHYGRGVVHNGKTIFVENALPEELVEINIKEEKKNYSCATSTTIIKKSVDRIIPECEYYFVCGGCGMLHITRKKELEFKQNKVYEILKKFTNGEIKVNNIVYTDERFNYRNKITLHVNNDIGYYEKKSKDIIPICKCMLVDQKINDLLLYIKTSIDYKNIKEIVIRKSKYTSDEMIIINITDSINEQDIINKLKNKVSSIIVKQNNEYKTIYGNGYIKDKMGDYTYLISKDSFFQVNTTCAIKLYDIIKKYASLSGSERVLDLYCGTGTIGIYLSKDASHILGIEINENAIENANKNKEINNISNIDFICGRSENEVSNIKEYFDVIIVDPPRKGLDSNTIEYLKKSKAKKIIYVSCDPVTLARDLNSLKDTYNICEVTPVDMFPCTYHVETACLLGRK